MPRVARGRIGRRTSNANDVYYFRQREQRLHNENQIYLRNALSLKSAFDYRFEIDYLNIPDIQIGAMIKVCPKCNAKKWTDETPGLCCSNGKVALYQFDDQPDLIKSLIKNAHPLSKHFLDNSRRYNSLFQMTSFAAKEINEGNFMPTFKIQGQIYHLIGSLLPQPEDSPKFLQIYFMSESDQISTRSDMIPNLNKNLIEFLQTVLRDNNRLIQSFKYNFESRTIEELHDLKLVIHADRVPQGQHRGQYNAPTIDEIAVLLVDEDKGYRDIVLHGRNDQLHRISELHPSYDALQYPLMFVKGEDGYHINILQQNVSGRPKTVSCMNYYSYRFMIRENCLNHLHYFKKLFSQYVVDMAAKMISERLNYLRYNQPKLRSENYIHLQDAINNDANINPSNVGQQVILPASLTGSPRYMHEKTQDAMSYVRKFGRPDLFITFTCNPEWPEIKNELFQDQKSFDRHDLISRVFHLKLKKFIKLLTKNCVFGEVNAHVVSIEWQKRGLPHAHILLWLQTKIQPDEIDKIISAEIPNKDQDPLLYEIVCKNMIHGPCGELNMRSPCMNNGKCSKKYPRKFIKDTQTGDDGYPTYRRRSPNDGGFVAQLHKNGQDIEIDNRWVVPYCPLLSRCFNAHINVEYCHSVQAIKYICKYVNKGSDRATFTVNNNNDEITNYVNGRYICTSEAFWRLFDFPIHERHPTVQHLAVHLENNQRIYFNEHHDLQHVLENPSKTTLTAFFELCSSDEFARTLLYPEVSSYYTWSPTAHKFSRRKNGRDVPGYPGIKKDTAIGRVYTIHPNQSECFHLRMLLHHVRGPTSFESLKTVNDIHYPTFKAACLAHGLLENDDQWKNTLADAALSESPSKLRDLFAIILVFCQPSEPQILWEQFRADLCEDILHRERIRQNNLELPFSEEIFNSGLIQIEDKVVCLSEKYLNEFGLNSPIRNEQTHDNPFDYAIRGSYDHNQLNAFVQDNLHKLVNDQRYAFEVIIDSVNNNRGKIFFLDAPGGTGKTFLINLLLASVRSKGKISLAVASSGIAATLLSGGRTAHSTFKLQLQVFPEGEYVCPIRENGPLGMIIQETSFVVWDECTMSHRAHIEAIDRSLRDLRSSNNLMGGITFVFAGDFRQTLPVIPKGTRADIINACLKSSPIWNYVEKLTLRTNMRAYMSGGDNVFPEQLLKIGNGSLENDFGYITIDESIGKIVTTIEDLISEVYPDISNLLTKSYNWLCERAIISPRNITAEEINNIILQKFEAESREYLSIDTVLSTDEAVDYPQEFLHSLTPSGFPPHKLILKIGASIMLLRNLQPPNLCNGTRLQITNLRNNVIEAIILTGPAAGEIAFIPRIPMIPTDLPFQFKRLQFPVKVSFAITINKSQGQTFKFVGVDLRTECFSHGQLYVAFSRTGNPNHQIILIPTNNKTKNVIYHEVL